MEESESHTIFPHCPINLWKKANHTQICLQWVGGCKEDYHLHSDGQKKRRKKRKKQYNTEIVYILTYKPSPQITLSFSSVSLSFFSPFFFSSFFLGGGWWGGGVSNRWADTNPHCPKFMKESMAQPVTGCLLGLRVHRNLLPFIRDRAQWVPKPNSITPSHTVS